MNVIRLSLVLSLAVLGVRLPAQEITRERVQDQVEAELPAGVRVADFRFKALGQPVKKVKTVVTVEATQNLYAPAELRPALQAAAAELSADLRNHAPAPLKLLKAVLAKGATAEPLDPGFNVVRDAGTVILELEDTESFLGLGKPRSKFPAGTLTEDSPEGRREIAAWEEAVKNYNAKVALTDQRARTDRNKELFVTVLDKGLGAYHEITRGPDSGAGENPGGPVEAFQGLPSYFLASDPARGSDAPE